MADSKNPAAAAGNKADDNVICKDRSRYVNARTASGKMSKRSDDVVAQAFEGLTLDQKYAIACQVAGLDEKEMRTKYANLNVGLQGMSLANRVRPVVKKDELAAAKLNKLVAPIHKLRDAAAAKASAEKKAAPKAAPKKAAPKKAAAKR
jgi:hypothetical protein